MRRLKEECHLRVEILTLQPSRFNEAVLSAQQSEALAHPARACLTGKRIPFEDPDVIA